MRKGVCVYLRGRDTGDGEDVDCREGERQRGDSRKESKRHAATGTGFLSPGAAFCAAIVDQSNTF